MENFESIIPFIIVVFWILSFIYKINKNKKTTASSSNPKTANKRPTEKPLLSKLQGSLEDFFEGLEESQETITTAKKVPPKLPTYKTLHTVEKNDVDITGETEVLYINPSTNKASKNIPLNSTRKQQLPSRNTNNNTTKDLQKAIIWSEILGKPVGLKNE